MRSKLRQCIGFLLLGCAVALPEGDLSANAPTHEYRGLWADAWGGDYTTPAKCTKLINDLRSANFNMLVIQARRRGDAFYNSRLEPKNPEIAGDFDPLADVVAKAHDTSGGKQRIEVHAWLVTYHIWHRQTPPAQPDHPYNLHRDWLMKSFDGEEFVGGQYTFDPGHPAVQQHTFDVCMELATNYSVDGIHFDYIRYADPNQGYHPVTVDRFNRLLKRSGKPDPNDEVWKQFRRDQVTALVRKVYLCAIAARPEIKISASTITWSPGVTTDDEWKERARPYTQVLQDWRAWMEEGILDINMPMTYFRQFQPDSAQDYYKWCQFIADHRHNRHAIIGPGLYLNSIPDSLHQMRYTRRSTPAGNRADGVCGYVYRRTSNEGSAEEFLTALVKPSPHDRESPPMFEQKAEVPPMPWKTAPTKGHLKGFIWGESAATPLDGATIQVSGAVKRTITSDATGFYGTVDLPPGSYTVSVDMPGYKRLETGVTLIEGRVTTRPLLLNKAASQDGR